MIDLIRLVVAGNLKSGEGGGTEWLVAPAAIGAIDVTSYHMNGSLERSIKWCC